MNPVTNLTYNVLQCYNCQNDCTCEWEYGNDNEIDGSKENGVWTSLDTNNQNGNTDVVAEVAEEAEESPMTSVEDSTESDVDQQVKAVSKCVSCHFNPLTKQRVCFNGAKWIPETNCSKI